MPQWIRNNTPDFLGAMSMKVSIKDEMIFHQTTVRKRLERVSEVWVVNETYHFGLDFVKETERGFRSTTSDMGAEYTQSQPLQNHRQEVLLL